MKVGVGENVDEGDLLSLSFLWLWLIRCQRLFNAFVSTSFLWISFSFVFRMLITVAALISSVNGVNVVEPFDQQLIVIIFKLVQVNTQ